MLDGKKIFVVMPAYNAARTLRQTCAELPRNVDAEELRCVVVERMPL